MTLEAFQDGSNPAPEQAFSRNDEIVRRLQDEFEARKKDSYLVKIQCIKCGDNSAFTSVSKPYSIRCNHKNSCEGASGIPWKEYFPDMPGDVFKVDFGRAQNYARKRGLSKFEHWGGEYKNAPVQGDYQALAFKLTNGGYNYRLVNPPTKDLSHMNEKGFKSSEAMWVPSDLDFSQRLYIAESPIKAMGLLEAGYQAVSTVSANHNPQRIPWIKEKLEKFPEVVVAFDNDDAGKNATRAWLSWLRKNDIIASVAFPAWGDWDDIQAAGKLDHEMMERCHTIGDAFTATSANEAAKVFDESGGARCPDVFEWRNSLYAPIYVKNKSGEQELKGSKEILDATISPAFSISVEAMDSSEPELQTYINVKTIEKGLSKKRKVRVTAEDFVSPQSLKTLLFKRTGAYFTGNSSQLEFLVRHIVKMRDMDRVRAIDRNGYDSRSGAFVFKNVAFKNGTMLDLNSDGYFSEIGIKPPDQDKAIKNISKKGDFAKLISLIHKAYKHQGMITLGYYAATILSNTIFNDHRFGFFPFLSNWGDKGTGKSTLVTLLNYAFRFQAEHEGQAMTAMNTEKGIVRTLAKDSCLPIVLSEFNKDSKNRFDENNFLPMYNRESPQSRANKTQDLSVNKVPFDAGLIFSQNSERFTNGAVKSRIISVHFPAEEFTPAQKSALLELQTLKNAAKDNTIPLTGFGVDFYRSLPVLEKKIIQYILDAYEDLRKEGINNERVAMNHAILLGTINLLVDHFEAPEGIKHEAAIEILCCAENRMDDLGNDSDLVNAFWDAFEQQQQEGVIQEGEHYIEDDDNVYIRMTETLKTLHNLGYSFCFRSEMNSELQRHKLFIAQKLKKSKAWRGNRNSVRCWIFKKR